MGETVDSGSGGGGGPLRSVARHVRNFMPLYRARPENNPLQGGDHRVVEAGLFCGTHATPLLQVPKTVPLQVPKNVVKLLRGDGGGVVRFLKATGELEVVDRNGTVVW